MSNALSLALPILGCDSGRPAGEVSPFLQRLEALRRDLLALDEEGAVARFQPGPHERLLKSTISLCPDCLEHAPALVYSRDGRVWIHKDCPRHGPSTAILENDERFYFLSNKDRWGRRYADDRVMAFPSFDGGCCGGSGCCGSSATRG